MRWLSCSVAPKLYKLCGDDPARKFPDASTFTFVWNAVEDMILSSWLAYLKRFSLDHISLHFDGVRIHGSVPVDIETLCKDCSGHILKDTKFAVKIRQKKHETMKEALLSRATRSTILEEAPEIYNATGNCIAYALRCLLGEHKAVLEHLSIDDAEDNRRAASRGHRSYAAVAALFKTHLLPKYGGSLSEAGDFLLHCEPAGSPHCMAVRVLPGAEQCEVFLQKKKIVVSLQMYNHAVRCCTDSRLLVVFQIVSQTESHCTSAHLGELLHLLAGASDDDSIEPLGLVVGADDTENAVDDADSDEDPIAASAVFDESIVTVGDRLLELLKAEVQSFDSYIKHYTGDDDHLPCRICRCLSLSSFETKTKTFVLFIFAICKFTVRFLKT